ncbi:hypothetical protein ITJ38_10075 [Agreia pratensis]|uniref:hypothetical protein n=1 Tax=Agreia pratensis TaxID=150121 RepID=UPI00188A9EF0|nr:hypothetical protein [Agreia pratensis]MBF4634747.1 hypothetical protein [Agreia pratensis]
MRRWTARYRFGWTPVISFDRRRSELLDWVESNLNPVSFRDSEGQVGLALRKGVRIVISRHGATIEDTVAASDGVASVLPVLEGLIDVMEPRDIVLADGSIGWSVDMNVTDYEAATHSLATRLSGVSESLPSGARAKDIATLMDFEGIDYKVQTEFGIVSPRELQERLMESKVGKLMGRPAGRVRPQLFETLPPTSLFVDTYFEESRTTKLQSVPEIIAAIARVDSAAEEVAVAVSQSVSEKENII